MMEQFKDSEQFKKQSEVEAEVEAKEVEEKEE